MHVGAASAAHGRGYEWRRCGGRSGQRLRGRDAPADRKQALGNVQQAVQAHRDEASGVHLGFADAVNDYIEKLMRSFE